MTSRSRVYLLSLFCCRLIIIILNPNPSPSLSTLSSHNSIPSSRFLFQRNTLVFFLSLLLLLSLSLPGTTLTSSSCRLYSWCCCHNNWCFLLPYLFLFYCFLETIHLSPYIFFCLLTFSELSLYLFQYIFYFSIFPFILKHLIYYSLLPLICLISLDI